MEKQVRNGPDLLEDIRRRVEEIRVVNVEKVAEAQVPPSEIDDPLKLAAQIKEAAGQLGDGKTDSPTAHTPINEGDTPPTYNSDQESESKKIWGLSANIKSAVLANVDVVEEKVAAAQGMGKKMLSIGVPMAALAGGGAAGYHTGRKVGDKIDRSNNSAYYQAGVYDAAKQLVRQLQAQDGGGNGQPTP